MKKRIRKKLSKYKCLKCGGREGVVSYHVLKTGRWISSRLSCFYCNNGITRKEYDQKVKEWAKSPDGIDFMGKIS